MIMMRVGNSRPASILRNANVDSFFRLAGFYLAEGSKTSSRASVSNTNTNLVAYYHHVALDWIQTEIRTYNTPKKGVRAAKQLLAIGGICLKTLLLNAIDGILEFLGSSANLSGGGLVLGLSFLNGYSDGDGSVTRSKQRNTPKQRVILRLTEGRLFYAAKLVRVLRRILGVGSMYKPRRRNYYEVIATLSPQRAALLLLSGFFSEHPENRRRLATKALDSAYLSRFVLLFSLFGAKPFSAADLARHASSIQADFIGRSVGTGQLVPVGVAKTGKDKRFHWLRSYVLSDDTQILAQRILESTGGLGVSA